MNMSPPDDHYDPHGIFTVADLLAAVMADKGADIQTVMTMMEAYLDQYNARMSEGVVRMWEIDRSPVARFSRWLQAWLADRIAARYMATWDDDMLQIQSPSWPKSTVREEDRTILRQLGFQCRTSEQGQPIWQREIA